MLLTLQPLANLATQRYSLVCDTGAYAYTGVATTLQRVYVPPIPRGTYAYTGVAATLTSTRTLSAATGAYSYAGAPATLVRYQLVAAPGAYAYTGLPATLTYTAGTAHYTLACDAGAYSYAGSPATLTGPSLTPAKVGGDDVPERVEIWTTRKAKKAATRIEQRIEALAEEAEQPIALPSRPKTNAPDWAAYLEALQALELALLAQWGALIDEEDEELLLLL